MSNDEVISLLNALIETSKDGEQGFVTCAENLKSPQLKANLTQRAEECADAATQLQDLVQALGGEPGQSASLVGEMHRRWIDIKAAVSGKNEKTILKECVRGEEVAVKNYQDALKEDLPTEVRAVLERQYEGVERNYEQVKILRDVAEAQG